MAIVYLNSPLTDESIAKLNVKDIVFLNGKIFTARDMAHLKLKKIFENNECFDEDLKGQVIFHAGPIVKFNEERRNYEIVAIGPTSSIRMEPYSDMIGLKGIKIIIGKGGMGKETTNAMKKHTMVYLLAAHGCSAVHTDKIKRIIKQYWLDEVGMPEALWVMECENFGPLIVGIDSKGHNLFDEVKDNSTQIIESIYPDKIKTEAVN